MDNADQEVTIKVVDDIAQVDWDAAEPAAELAAPEPVGTLLEDLLMLLDHAGRPFFADVHTLSDRQATAAIWIDGHEYSLTLNRED